MATYYISTVGCQMNKEDSARMAAALEQAGLTEATEADQADVVVVNSCSVRASAEEHVAGQLGWLKGLKRQRPELVITLAGCMVGPDTERALQKHFPYVDVFLRPSQVRPLLAFVQQRGMTSDEGCLPLLEPEATSVTGFRTLPDLASPVLLPPQTRLGVSHWVSIIYGCDKFCTYCIVPFRRGRERSRPIRDIVAEVEALVERGVREVVLLGQTVEAYGHDLPDCPDLADLFSAIHDIPGLKRIRFLTSYPKDMTDRIIAAVAELPKVCEHINIPVQSGADTVLARMRRGYTVAEYRDLIQRIRSRIPDVALSSDVIVGFSGETEAEFDQTYRLIEELRFDVVHVAAYSPRPGTVAARWEDDVPPEEKSRRLHQIEALQERIASEINRRMEGQTVEILVEGMQRGRWFGRTRTDKLVFSDADGDWRGRLVPVRIDRATAWSLQGQITVQATAAVEVS